MCIRDRADMVPVPVENSAAFIVTARRDTVQSICPGSNGTFASWCPPENPNATATSVLQTEKHNITVWFRGQVSFPSLGSERLFHSAEANTCVLYPQNKFNCISIPRLAQMAGSGGELSEVCGTGCIIQVTLKWDCDVLGATCHPEFKATRLDTGAHGFNTRTASYWANGTERELHKLYGVRVLVLMDGQGYKVSAVAIFTQLGAGIGLLSISCVVTDFVLKNLYRVDQRRGELYRRFKMEEAPDFAGMDPSHLEVLEHALDLQERVLADSPAELVERRDTKRDLETSGYSHLKG
eukprot:TRINITY_DN10774_c0_g1_i7.p1 TRINITY_DN10774_c0_g1~~TRINITY_DN10774_c0_g1_i7.p1  ORF type:complete len:295 (+),score=84.44 TRINITY_DN10774_c0_g1_i7:129-1013(+)